MPAETPTPPGPDGTAPDEVRARRRRIARWVRLAKRIGYSLLLLAILAFAIALTTGFEGFWVIVCVVSLLTAVAILPIPIIVGYGVRAAEREDRARG
ncbi:MAG: hypothetical protein ACKO72_06970 [Actinomycetes bacterium]